MKHRPNQAMAYFVLSGTVIFSVLYVEYLLRAAQETQAGWFGLGLLGLKPASRLSPAFMALRFCSDRSFIWS